MTNQAEKTSYIENVAAYIRVSTQEQKLHGISIEAQEEKLNEYADSHGMKIVKFYKDEGVSGRKLIRKRPALQAMIQDAEKGNFRRIIFIKLDRFFRSVAEYHECMKRLAAGGVIWTATEEKYDLSTPSGEAFVNMKLTMAQFEADQVGERIRMINEYKVKSGQPLYGSQALPFCYQVKQSGDGDRRKYIAKRDEIIMEDLIDHFCKNRSVRATLHYINAKYSRAFSYSTIKNALTSELICGTYRGNPAYCEGYMTPAAFETMQKYIQHNPRTSQREHSYIFGGLIRCPCCGNMLVGSPTVLNRIGKSGQKLSYKYYGYRCHRGNLEKKCDFRTMAFEHRLEAIMLSEVEAVMRGKQMYLLRLQNAPQRVAQHDLAELQQELARLNYAWQKGRIKTAADYDRQYDDLMTRIDAANAERQELAANPDYRKISRILSDGWKQLYISLDNDHKRAFWRAFIEEIQLEWTKDVKRIRDITFFT